MAFDVVAATAYLICGALLLFLGFVVLRENPRQRVNRATAGMLVFGGLGPMLGAYSTLSSRAGAGPAGFQDAFAQFTFLWEFFFPSVLLFALVFPTLNPMLRRHRWLVVALFVPHLFHLLLVMLFSDSTRLLDRIDFQSLLPVGQGVMDRGLGLVRIALELLFRVHVRFFSVVNLAMAVTSWVLLMRSAQRTLNPKLRAQVRTIRLGIGLSLALYSGGELVPNVFGVEVPRALSLPLITVSLLVGAVSIVVAIVRLGFLDVRFIVRRGLVYGLAAGGVVASYLFVGKQIDQLSAPLMGARVPFFETLFLVLSVFLLQPVLSGIERVVDRGYSRDRSDLRNALTRLAEEVALLLDPAQVCEAVSVTMRREMVLRSVAVVHRDPRTGAHRVTVARESVETLPDWKPGGVLLRALEGRREAVPAQEIVEQPELPEERDALAAGLGWIGGETVIPLVAADRRTNGDGPAGARGSEVIGALLLGEKVTETRLTFEETALVSLIGHQVGISLQNAALHEERIAARLLEEEVSTARKIQQQLLPMCPPQPEGWELCASNNPSRHVGGDYHDFLPLPGGGLGIAIADVSGKGVPAALLMSNLQATLRGRVLAGAPTELVVQDVNRHMCSSTGPESFISFFLGELHPERGTLSFTNAGHNAPVLVRGDGRVELLEDGGLLLGVFPEATYERGEVRLEPGDMLLLYTDGLTEAGNPAGDLFSEERLVEALRRHRGCSVREMHEGILEEIREFQEGRVPDDDLTLVLLRRMPAGEPVPAGGDGPA